MFYKYNIFILSIFFFFTFFLLPKLLLVRAASLRFNPATATAAINSTVSFDVIVDTGGENVTSADAFVQYDTNSIQVVSVTEGSFFPSVSYNTDTAGKLYIAGVVTSAATYKNGEGVLASVTVKGLQNISTTITFQCTTGSTTDSNIAKNDVNATDIISCSDNNSIQLTIGTGSSGTSGNNNTGTSNQNNNGTTNITPTALPKTGNMEKVALGSLLGIGLLVIGGLAKMFL